MGDHGGYHNLWQFQPILKTTPYHLWHLSKKKWGMSQMRLSINGGIPKWMVDDGSLQRQIMENPIDMDDLGVPSILGNFHIFWLIPIASLSILPTALVRQVASLD